MTSPIKLPPITVYGIPKPGGITWVYWTGLGDPRVDATQNLGGETIERTAAFAGVVLEQGDALITVAHPETEIPLAEIFRAVMEKLPRGAYVIATGLSTGCIVANMFSTWYLGLPSAEQKLADIGLFFISPTTINQITWPSRWLVKAVGQSKLLCRILAVAGRLVTLPTVPKRYRRAAHANQISWVIPRMVRSNRASVHSAIQAMRLLARTTSFGPQSPANGRVVVLQATLDNTVNNPGALKIVQATFADHYVLGPRYFLYDSTDHGVINVDGPVVGPVITSRVRPVFLQAFGLRHQ